MENKRIHLVLTYIEEKKETAKHYYLGEDNEIECLLKVSNRASSDQIMVPLWFDSEQEARDYIKKASESTEKEYWLIQEFSYHCETIKDEAKIVMKVKSDTWPVLAEGKTERSPGIWAHVRSIFICDKSAAEEYVSRFDEDARLVFERGKHEA